MQQASYLPLRAPQILGGLSLRDQLLLGLLQRHQPISFGLRHQ
jgi:hypothetical protein